MNKTITAAKNRRKHAVESMKVAMASRDALREAMSLVPDLDTAKVTLWPFLQHRGPGVDMPDAVMAACAM
jgi:hypothetical protein